MLNLILCCYTHDAFLNSEFQFLPSCTQRMSNIMDILVTTFCKNVKESLSPHTNIFSAPFLFIKSALSQARDGIDSFLRMLARLSNVEFCINKKHRWSGLQYSNASASKLSSRIHRLLTIRSAYEEMLSILGPEKKRELIALNSFDVSLLFRSYLLDCLVRNSSHHNCLLVSWCLSQAFMSINPLNTSQYADEKFEEAVQAYDAKANIIDQLLKGAIKQKINPLQQSPLLLLASLQKISNLLKRPGIYSTFSSQIDSLMGTVERMVCAVESDIDTVLILNDHLTAVLKCRQYYSKVNWIIGAIRDIDSNDASSICTLCTEIVEKCKNVENEAFSVWLEDTSEALENDTLKLSGTLIEISQDGTLEVNFNEKLIELIRHERHFAELGFSIPAAIKRSTSEAQKYLGLGVTLRKVAVFFNSFENYIIPSQRTMLLDMLVAFEDIINSQRDKAVSTQISWNSQRDCENFTEKLHKAAEVLRAENNRLRSMHDNLCQLTASLVSTDLLSQKSSWLKVWREIQQFFASIKCPANRMAKWIR